MNPIFLYGLPALLLLLVAALVVVRMMSAPKATDVPRDRARHGYLARRVEELGRVDGLPEQLVDASGRCGLLWDAAHERVVVVRAGWSADGTGASAPELAARALDGSELVGAEIRAITADQPKDGRDRPMALALELVVFVDDLAAPVLAVDLLDRAAVVGGPRHLDALALARVWEARLRALIHRHQSRAAARHAADALLSAADAGAVDPGVARRAAAQLKIGQVLATKRPNDPVMPDPSMS